MWSAELTFRDELSDPGALVNPGVPARALRSLLAPPHDDDPLYPNASREACAGAKGERTVC